MAANSIPRRIIKTILAPVLKEQHYAVFQALAMTWDIRSGGWSEPELELIPRAVRRGETAIDIGANFGLYAYHLARAVGSTGKVYCFEPIPFTAATFRLVSRMLSFSHVQLVEKGCGEKTAKVPFAVPVVKTGAISAGLVHMAQRRNDRDGRQRHAQFDTTKEVLCDVVALDDYLPEVTNLSLVKCDIEGADLFAMRGARQTLAKHHPTVIIEINPWFMEGFGLKVSELVDFFGELGYELYRYDGVLHPAAAEDIVEDNWVFVHPTRRDRLASLLPPEA